MTVATDARARLAVTRNIAASDTRASGGRKGTTIGALCGVLPTVSSSCRLPKGAAISSHDERTAARPGPPPAPPRSPGNRAGYQPGPAVYPTDAARRFQIKLRRHTGAVLLWQQRTYVVTGTVEECERAYRAAQVYNLTVGWWSPLSIVVMNWVALFSNMSAMHHVRHIAKRPAASYAPLPNPQPTAQAPAGWYPDPSGAPRQRYWNGATWT